MNTSPRITVHALNGLSSEQMRFSSTQCAFQTWSLLSIKHQHLTAGTTLETTINNNLVVLNGTGHTHWSVKQPPNSHSAHAATVPFDFSEFDELVGSKVSPRKPFVRHYQSEIDCEKQSALACCSMAVKEISSVTWSSSWSRCCECCRFIFVSRGSSFDDLCWHQQRIKTSPPFSKGPRFSQIFTRCTG